MFRGDLGNSGAWFLQMVGLFGSLDTYAPSFTYLSWFVAVGLVSTLGVMVAQLRVLVTFLLLVLLTLFLPVIVE